MIDPQMLVDVEKFYEFSHGKPSKCEIYWKKSLK